MLLRRGRGGMSRSAGAVYEAIGYNDRSALSMMAFVSSWNCASEMQVAVSAIVLICPS